VRGGAATKTSDRGQDRRRALLGRRLSRPGARRGSYTAALPPIDLFGAFGVAMIAVLWTYDGWYGLTFSAGEMRRPERDLPLGLIGGTALVTLLYALINVAYFRALPVESMGGESRIAEAAAGALFGTSGAQLVAAVVALSSLGCVAATSPSSRICNR
jgi:amino acid transporter